MGFAQWFWRLFLVFAGLIVGHVLLVTLLVMQSGAAASGAFPYAAVWLSAAVVIGAERSPSGCACSGSWSRCRS